MSAVFDSSRHPHRRRNPLTGDWVVVSPHRAQRPWQGRSSAAEREPVPRFDPTCALCPGVARSGGAINPDYQSTFVFENDHPALSTGITPPNGRETDDLFRIAEAAGECRVVCFSPRHDLALSQMSPAEIAIVIALWRDQSAELSESWEWVQAFETRGEISGASNPHPHGQIWASDFLPNEAVSEIEAQSAHHAAHSSPLLLDYAQREASAGTRTVAANDVWIAAVPFWAYWPYETIVAPRRPLRTFAELDRADIEGLADVVHRMLTAFDRLFDVPFPYCSGWHAAPRSGAAGFQLHAHYYPPLLRSADVPKIPASYELLANLQRDLTPEAAAAHLRGVL